MTREFSSVHVQNIVSVLRKYELTVTKKQNFSAKDMMDFMEPYFRREGYREKILPTMDSKKFTPQILILTDTPAIGDFIVVSPLLREIRRVYPLAHIALTVHENIFSLAEFCPYTDEIITVKNYNNGTDFEKIYAQCLIKARKLLSRKWDIAFAMSFGNYSGTILTAYMSGATKIISTPNGTNRYFVEFLTDNVMPLLYGTHAVDTCLGYLDYLLAAPIANRQTEVWFNQDDIVMARQLTEGMGTKIALCVGGSKLKRHYPPEYYAKFLDLLDSAEYKETNVVILGGKDDVEEAQIITSLTQNLRILNLAGKLTLRQTVAVMSLCSYCVSNNTSTNHMASAVNVPVLSPFPMASDIKLPFVSDLERWYPYGVPSVIVQPKSALGSCQKALDPDGCIADYPHCIKQITPAALYEGFKRLVNHANQHNNYPLLISAG